jgi:hypothetical protein
MQLSTQIHHYDDVFPDAFYVSLLFTTRFARDTEHTEIIIFLNNREIPIVATIMPFGLRREKSGKCSGAAGQLLFPCRGLPTRKKRINSVCSESLW